MSGTLERFRFLPCSGLSHDLKWQSFLLFINGSFLSSNQSNSLFYGATRTKYSQFMQQPLQKQKKLGQFINAFKETETKTTRAFHRIKIKVGLKTKIGNIEQTFLVFSREQDSERFLQCRARIRNGYWTEFLGSLRVLKTLYFQSFFPSLQEAKCT